MLSTQQYQDLEAVALTPQEINILNGTSVSKLRVPAKGNANDETTDGKTCKRGNDEVLMFFGTSDIFHELVIWRLVQCKEWSNTRGDSAASVAALVRI